MRASEHFRGRWYVLRLHTLSALKQMVWRLAGIVRYFQTELSAMQLWDESEKSTYLDVWLDELRNITVFTKQKTSSRAP